MLSVPSLDELETTRVYEFSIAWSTPIFTSLLYLCIVTYWSRLNNLPMITQNTPKPPPKDLSYLFQAVVILHNLILCLFSAVVFISVFPELVRQLQGPDRIRVLFDHSCGFYHKVLGIWAWIFYISKYYELIDTLILLLKGKPSSFLQTFHHTGAIICMWALTVSRNPTVWIFVSFNSFIHTWMYLYYLLTCFGYYSPWKRLLTNLQITQFAIGNPLGILTLVCGYMVDIPHKSDRLAQILGISNLWSQTIALSGNIVYVSALIALFLDFSRKTYNPNNNHNNNNSNKKKAE